MRSQVALQPGQKGTQKLLDHYGSQLVCVRDHYDEQRQRRLKTVELIVEEVKWKPKPKPISGDIIVGIHIK